MHMRSRKSLMGKGILHGFQKLDNVQHLDPVLRKVLFEKAFPPDQFLPDSITQDNVASETVSLGKFIIIVGPFAITVYLGQLDGGVAV